MVVHGRPWGEGKRVGEKAGEMGEVEGVHGHCHRCPAAGEAEGGDPEGDR